jgi:hypothetical protein
MALADLDAIDLHYRRLDSGLADRIGGQIVRAAAFVGDVPHGGQADDRDRRRWRVAGTPMSSSTASAAIMCASCECVTLPGTR